jgi:hypothetical protein
MRVLNARELNRALLARQLLLRRSKASIPRVLEQMAGLQAQYAPSMYIGLWTRIAGFDQAALTRALERRTVVQGTLMRATIHLVSAADYWALATAIRSSRREWYRRVARSVPDAGQLAAAADVVRSLLADGPKPRRVLEAAVGRDVWSGLGLWLDMVRVPPSGTWERRRADLYAAAEDWIGPGVVSPEAGLELLVRRYLSGFGPALAKEIADWSGVPLDTINAALDRLTLSRFATEDGKVMLDLPRALLPGDVPAPVRFLPVWDATLLIHARRKGVIAEEYRPFIFNTKTPQSQATFLVDGTVAGVWRLEAGRVTTEPFAPLPRVVKRELEEEAAALTAFHR